jgi:hypothetical protein
VMKGAKTNKKIKPRAINSLISTVCIICSL